MDLGMMVWVVKWSMVLMLCFCRIWFISWVLSVLFLINLLFKMVFVNFVERLLSMMIDLFCLLSCFMI